MSTSVIKPRKSKISSKPISLLKLAATRVGVLKIPTAIAKPIITAPASTTLRVVWGWKLRLSVKIFTWKPQRNALAIVFKRDR